MLHLSLFSKSKSHILPPFTTSITSQACFCTSSVKTNKAGNKRKIDTPFKQCNKGGRQRPLFHDHSAKKRCNIQATKSISPFSSPRTSHQHPPASQRIHHVKDKDHSQKIPISFQNHSSSPTSAPNPRS